MTRIVACLAVLFMVAATPAWAQEQFGAGGGLHNPGNFGPSKAKPATGNREPAPPSALPGARAEPTAVAPPTNATPDLPPNEALFDAINRGDLPAAKDAVARGAEINSHNVLGLTPIDLAVDLGRNQISFYLLSLRGAGFSTPNGPPVPAKAETRAERVADIRESRAERARDSRDRTALPPLPAAPRTARLFAGNGGAPVPSVGFLGFGSGR